jgi:hypothetical protein
MPIILYRMDSSPLWLAPEPIYDSSYMFDWGKAFEISKMTLHVASSIFALAVISSSDVGKRYFEWIVARRGYEVMDNPIGAHMRVEGSIVWVSLAVAIVSCMSSVICLITIAPSRLRLTAGVRRSCPSDCPDVWL